MNAVTRYLNSESSKVVIWLTDQAELCEQAYDEFERCWQYQGTKPINVYRYWGDSDLNSLEDITEGIIIAGLQKLNPYAMKDISAFSRLGAHTGLIVMDEAHKAIAETYRFIIDGLAVDSDNTGILGLSATPGRTLEDIDRDGELSDFFNRTKVTLRVDGYEDPIDYLISEGYLADPVFESLTYEGGPDLSPQDIATIKDSPELPDQVIKRLTADSARNLLIVQKIKEMANRFDRILLFCLNVEHTKLMTAALQSVGINAQYVTGETPVSRRQTILNNFRSSAPDVQVICNFDVLTTGFDAPNCHAALIARPTSSLVLYLQMVGRVIRGRKQGGSDVAEIITVNDLNIGVFADIAKGFRNWEDVWDD